jgi:inner membrane transporter RhtA
VAGQGRRQDPLGKVPAPLLIGSGIVCVQFGAGLAGRAFSQVSAAGMTGLRLWIAALVLAALGGRPAVRAVRGIVAARAWRDAALITGFGLTLAIMNYSFYQAFARIPLGIAVTIEFLGPLAVAVASSRRLLDLLWVALAGLGVALLGQGGVGQAGLGAATSGGAGHGHAGTVLAGVGFALVAATCWAIYILVSASTGRRFAGSAGLVAAMVIAALVVTPTAVISGGIRLLRPGVLLTGLLVGLLSSVIPYRFELESLRRVPARVFGIAMSLEPAVAALFGLVMLGQSLSLPQWLATGCVIVACAGATLGAGRSPQAPQA